MKDVEKFGDFITEQNDEWNEKRLFLFILLFFREREIEVWNKKFCKRAKFFVSVRHFKAILIFWSGGLVMILFYFKAGFGSGLKVSGSSYEFYASSEVFHVFC